MPKFERVQMMKSLSPFFFWLMEDAGALQITLRFSAFSACQASRKRSCELVHVQPIEPCEQTADLNHDREGAMLLAHEALKAANTAAIHETS